MIRLFSVSIVIAVLAASSCVYSADATAKIAVKPVVEKTTIAATQDTNAYIRELKDYITAGDKTAIQGWAKRTGALAMNRAVSTLTGEQKRALAGIIVTSPVEGAARTNLIGYIAQILDSPYLGFYVELFAETPVGTHPGEHGGYAAGDHISIADGLLATPGAETARNTLVHELFHIFNHRENGAGGISGLNEGTAIWIFKLAFGNIPESEKELGLAEPTFGTIGYYRDIGIKGYPKDIPFGVPENITAKGREVYEEILMKKDPSKMPIFDQEKLQTYYDTYFKDLNRNQDFAVYLKEFKQRLKKMQVAVPAQKS